MIMMHKDVKWKHKNHSMSHSCHVESLDYFAHVLFFPLSDFGRVSVLTPRLAWTTQSRTPWSPFQSSRWAKNRGLEEMCWMEHGPQFSCKENTQSNVLDIGYWVLEILLLILDIGIKVQLIWHKYHKYIQYPKISKDIQRYPKVDAWNKNTHLLPFSHRSPCFRPWVWTRSSLPATSGSLRRHGDSGDGLTNGWLVIFGWETSQQLLTLW